MAERALLNKRDTDFVRENMLINYCLNSEEKLLIESFVKNNGIELKFDLNAFYFFITGVHLKYHPQSTVESFNAGISRTLLLYDLYDRAMGENGYAGNAFLIKVDNSKQLGVIFSAAGEPACTPEEMAEKLYRIYMTGDDPYFARSEASTSFAGPYRGYEQISEAFIKARKLNDLHFFGVRDIIITEEFRSRTAKACDTMAVFSGARRLLPLISGGERIKALNHLNALVDGLVAPSYSMTNFYALQSGCEDILDILREVYPDRVHLPRLRAKDHLSLERFKAYMRENLNLLFGQLEGARMVSPTLLMALSYINRNYASDLSLQQISEYVYVNVSTLSSEFNAGMGMSLSEYVTGLRIRHADELLRETALSVSEIAGQVGFPNVKYFREVFKKRTGMTPAEARKKKE